MVIHKLKYNGTGGFTECNRCILMGGEGCTHWGGVTCKSCLKKKKKKNIALGRQVDLSKEITLVQKWKKIAEHNKKVILETIDELEQRVCKSGRYKHKSCNHFSCKVDKILIKKLNESIRS